MLLRSLFKPDRKMSRLFNLRRRSSRLAKLLISAFLKQQRPEDLPGSAGPEAQQK